MTRLAFLSPREKRLFDTPPTLNKKNRPAYFILTSGVRKTLSALKTPTTKVGFLLELGYFKHSAKFFMPEQFKARDIQYVKQLLHITQDIDLTGYQRARPGRYRARILTLLDWAAFNDSKVAFVAEHVQLLAQQQLKPQQIFMATVDFCWKHRIEVPSYHQLSEVITDSFNIVESRLLSQLEALLCTDDRTKLDYLIRTPPDQRGPLLSQLKSVNQSLRPSEIQKNVDACATLAEHFVSFQPLIGQLSLPDQATEYYATWVQKAKITQLKQLSNPSKRYLHLLAYIKHQYMDRQDLLVDIFLKSVRTAVNAANKCVNTIDQKTRTERRQAIRSITKSHKNARRLLEEITRVVKTSALMPSEKIQKIERLIDDYQALQTESETSKLAELEDVLSRDADGLPYYEALDRQSLRTQRRVASVLKALVFDASSPDQDLLSAVLHFQRTDGQIGQAPPMAFLTSKEQTIVNCTQTFRTSLYKMLLFQYTADAIRAGKMNISFSYRYRAIQDYLIPEAQWHAERYRLMELAGLTRFSDGERYLADLKHGLEERFRIVNERYRAGDNPHLSVDDDGLAKIRTPGTAFNEEQAVADLLVQRGIVPVQQLLRDVDQISHFIGCFKHLSPKHSKLKPTPETVLAGILGKGCNIGVDKLANISVGINTNTLRNTVSWCFSLKNIQAANNTIINLVDKLALSNAFRKYPDELHTSSDGRKVNVAVDSIHANYSFKYFGNDKGVTMYTFIDERHALFYSTVISASDREAAFVIDGLLQNDVVKSDIHSTDTHGFTESIFAATHLIDTAFAPRIKKIGKQKLYGFSSKATYKKRGYAILPSRTINQKLILKNWDDILRFMATIKLRFSSASQLFKRLSSYAKDHPLYQALKEFGRIIKTQFILTYYDDLELRQRIEKQLNKVELANRFSKAVFFANNQEFQDGTKEEQEIATACKVLIQNAIVLWNYLYLSQLLARTVDPEQRNDMIEAIVDGSILTWRHVNLQGEYDFRRTAANDTTFDLPSILALKLA